MQIFYEKLFFMQFLWDFHVIFQGVMSQKTIEIEKIKTRPLGEIDEELEKQIKNIIY